MLKRCILLFLLVVQAGQVYAQKQQDATAQTIKIDGGRGVEGVAGANTKSSSKYLDAAQLADDYEQMFVGVIVHQQEKSSLDVFKYRAQLSDGETEYLVPFAKFLSVIGSRYSIQQGKALIDTDAGLTAVSLDELFTIDGDLWASVHVLNRHLKVNIRFSQSKYALLVFPPWQGQDLAIGKGIKDVGEVDIYPNPFSIRQLRFSHALDSLDSDIVGRYSELITSGSALSGSWWIELDKYEDEKVRASEYFWISPESRNQWLVGKQSISSSVLSPLTTMTGVQYFHSNQDLEYNATQNISQIGFSRKLGNGVRRIVGAAQAGAIAQLHVDTQVVAEVFVRLDGSYDFGEIQLPSTFFNEVKVYIIDPVTRALIEKQNKTRASADDLLKSGQAVSSFAIGKKGNVLDPYYVDTGEAGMAMYRYGVSSGLTLEAGYLHDDIATSSLGLAAAVGKNFVTAFRFADRNNASASQWELDGYGKRWRLSTYTRRYEAGFSELFERDVATSNFYYQASQRLRLALVGRYDSADNIDEFVKPGFAYRYSHALSLSMMPDYDSHYRSEVHYTPSSKQRVLFTHKPSVQTLRADWDINNSVTAYYSGLRAGYTEFTEDTQLFGYEDDNTHAIGAYLRSADWDYRNFLRAELGRSSRAGLTVFAEYRAKIFQGTFFDFNVRNTQRGSEKGLSAFARVTFDFAFSGGKMVAADSFISHNTDGTLVGEIITDTGKCEMKKISLIIDGYGRQAAVDGCRYYLERVRPGVHRVKLDTEFLPIHMLPENRNYIVEVAASAVSTLNFSVNSEYGVAGRVTLTNGKMPSEAVWLRLYDAAGEKLQSVKTDQFGYYRADGLRAGDYTIAIEASEQDGVHVNLGSVLSKRAFTIEDKFIFGLNLIVDAK